MSNADTHCKMPIHCREISILWQCWYRHFAMCIWIWRVCQS